MPLQTANTNQARGADIRELEHAGHKPSQAIAIAEQVTGNSNKNADDTAIPSDGESGAIARLNDLRGIASFRPGKWNGQTITLKDEQDMVANFQKYSTGDQPYYRPYLSINHKDELACGYVNGCYLDGEILTLDGTDLPAPVAQWIRDKQIRQPSIEFWEPSFDSNGNAIDGFMMPDGNYSPTCVLKCVTLLGADAPAVKGLRDLPAPTPKFSDRSRKPKHGKAKRFACEATTGVQKMGDRSQMIAALQRMGMDTSVITDAVPDETLSAFLKMVQTQGNNPKDGQMADQPKPPDQNPFATDPDPAKMVTKTNDSQGYNDAQNLPNDDGRGNPNKNHDSIQNLPMGKDGNVIKAGDGGDAGKGLTTGNSPAQLQQNGALSADDMSGVTGISPSMPFGDNMGPHVGGMPPQGANCMSTMPKTIIHKFADASGKTPPGLAQFVNQITDTLNAVIAQNQTLMAGELQRQRVNKETKIRMFADRLRQNKTAAIPPALLLALCKTLWALDDGTVRKFADGKTMGSTLDEAMHDLEKNYSPPRNLNEKINQPHTGNPGQGGMDRARIDAMIANDKDLQDAKRANEKRKAKQESYRA